MNQNRIDVALELVRSESAGALSTQSLKHEGYPFVSSTPFAIDRAGSPVLLLSWLATHTKNLLRNPKSSLLISATNQVSDARLTIMGDLGAVPESDLVDAKERYLSKHPSAQQWISFGDFGLFRLRPVDLYLVAGFGSMGWIKSSDYTTAIQQ